MQEVDLTLLPDSLGESALNILIEIGLKKEPISSYDIHKIVGIGYSTVFSHCKNLEKYGLLISEPDPMKKKPQKFLYHLSFIGVCHAISSIFGKCNKSNSDYQGCIAKTFIALLENYSSIEPVFKIYLDIIRDLKLNSPGMTTEWQISILYKSLAHACKSYTWLEEDDRGHKVRYHDFVYFSFSDVADEIFSHFIHHSESELELIFQIYSRMEEKYRKMPELWSIIQEETEFALRDRFNDIRLFINVLGKEKIMELFDEFEHINSVG